jgi:hypothetical protein
MTIAVMSRIIVASIVPSPPGGRMSASPQYAPSEATLSPFFLFRSTLARKPSM